MKNINNKYLEWSKEKNKWLIQNRKVSFEEIKKAINDGNIWKITNHPNQIKYPHQQICIVIVDEYVYKIPFVEDKYKYFLKTIIPSRKLTKQYLKENKND